MLDVLIIHFNTPELTEAAIRSLWKHTPGARVTIFDNSDKRPFTMVNGKCSMVNVIDNTRGQVVDWDAWLDTFPDKIPGSVNNYGSAKHCYSVELCLERFPEGFILMDSDVLVKQDISCFCRKDVPWVGWTKHTPRRWGAVVWRVVPFLCWINTPVLRQHGIRYFSRKKMGGLVSGLTERCYDTGCYFLEACERAGLHGERVGLADYIEHYGHASWHQHGDYNHWLEEHKKLWK